MNKINPHIFIENIDYLQCPICGCNFKVAENQLKCEKNHSFDISKHNYVNFLVKPINNNYTKDLFKSRKIIVENNFFDVLENSLTNLLKKEIAKKNGKILISDIGCGEGTLFSRILNNVKLDNFEKNDFEKKFDISAIGLDLAKEGIQLASKNNQKIVWLVGNMANIPIKSNSVDIILNILSPANYSEFRRILKDDGLIIKTIPNENYLQEIRKTFEKNDYSNEEVVKIFKSNFPNFDGINVFSKKAFNFKKDIFFKMTPLTWNTDISLDLLDKIEELTLDFSILYARK